jgi:hypothetical protein
MKYIGNSHSNPESVAEQSWLMSLLFILEMVVQILVQAEIIIIFNDFLNIIRTD